MKKRKIYIFIITFVGIILSTNIIYTSSVNITSNNIPNKKFILSQIENNITDNNFDNISFNEYSNYINNEYKDVYYYFINGYIDYLNKDYTSATYNLKQSKKLLSSYTSAFVKIYTPLLLNKCLLNNGSSEELIENCKLSASYMSKEKKYKNNTELIWENISVLTNSRDTIPTAINILTSYLDTTKGLMPQCKVKLLANIGGLYTFKYNYSQATYYYFSALDLLSSSKNIENKDFLMVRLLSNVADINYSLGAYDNALYYYDKAIAIDIVDKKRDSEAKAIIIINKVSTYIELGKYNEALLYADNIGELISYLPPDFKDDVEILNYNNLALANIKLGNLDLGEKYINLAFDLLKNDNSPILLNKEDFLSFTAAQLYKEQELYDKSIELFKSTLDNVKQKGLGLEELLYASIRDIYEIKNDFTNYIKYNNLYLKEKDFNQDILKEDYIKYSISLYENDVLKRKEYEHKLNMLALALIPIVLGILLIFKIHSIKKLRLSNFTNSMTGLYNRSYLDYYMKKNKSKLVNNDLSVILLDIDYFKNYNDNYGHLKGDEIIREVANTLKSSVRNSDICIRYGGEEMVIILPNTNLNECKNVILNIYNNIKLKNIEHSYSIVSNILTVSMGIYTKHFCDSDDIYEFIDKADQALYISKNTGRNKYTVYVDYKN